MKSILRTGFLALAIIALAVSADAGPYENGLAAYQRGDYATALKFFRPLAEKGDAIAQTSLGFMYENGEGVPQDDAEVVKWYRKAAEQGYAGAQYNLGLMYRKSKGVPQDDAEAVKWFRKAAEQGLADAQDNLGRMYLMGRGVPQDDAEAVTWFRKAAEQGFAKAQNSLDDIAQKNRDIMAERGPWEDGLAAYMDGDYAVALNFWRPLAEQGDAKAQINLGRMYESGQGVPNDDAEAVKWYGMAAEQGDVDAQYRLCTMPGWAC